MNPKTETPRPSVHPAALPATAAEPRRVAIVGATGFAGQELVRLIARHPGARLTVATASQATSAPRRLPSLTGIWDGQVEPLDPGAVETAADVVFLALPEAASAGLAPRLVDAGCRVIDLSGAFRIMDKAVRALWYPATEVVPDGVAYGLTEFGADAIREARLVANPGCYPTATLLGILPLARQALVDPAADIVVDAKSGLSGAGKTPSDRTHFSENHGSVAAYKPLAHRHAPEIAEALGRDVSFVPHLVPLDRGILCTIHTRLAPGVTADAVAAAFDAAYATAPFVRLRGPELPEIKHVAWSNFCDIGWHVDEPSRRLVVVSVIDNLLKGAAGSAVQNFNVTCGFDQALGLL